MDGLPRLYDEYKSKSSVDAKTNHLKAINIYAHRNNHTKQGRLIKSETYDTSGNIVTCIDHHYTRYRWYDKTEYHYDSLGRISIIIKNYSFDKGTIEYLELIYTSNNKIQAAIYGSGIPGQINLDTIRYSYLANGKLNYLIKPENEFGHHFYDTMYYHYTSDGVFVSADSAESTFSGGHPIRNANGCVIGYTDTNETKHTMVCDSLCNILQYKEEFRMNGQWATIRYIQNLYKENLLIEEKSYACKRNLFDKLSKELKLEYHYRYERNEAGLMFRIIEYNRRGKIIEVSQYEYEKSSQN